MHVGLRSDMIVAMSILLNAAMRLSATWRCWVGGMISIEIRLFGLDIAQFTEHREEKSILCLVQRESRAQDSNWARIMHFILPSESLSEKLPKAISASYVYLCSHGDHIS
jgi:hypothetical protein